MKIMVSACLLGDNVKYNGENNKNHKLIEFLKKYNYEVIKVCPEVLGGLSIPRAPAEIIDDRVINTKNIDVTERYHQGAKKTLAIARDNNIEIAILKKNSPSCGSGSIYDGTFSHTLIEGDGTTSRLLKENGIKVFNEDNYLKYFEKESIYEKN